MILLFCLQQRTAIDSADFIGISDDKMLEAVLELSQEEAGALDQPPLEDEPTSSPDTGFGDTEAHDLASNTNLLEPDTRQSTGSVEVCLPRHMQITGPLMSPWVLNLESPLSHPLYSLSFQFRSYNRCPLYAYRGIFPSLYQMFCEISCKSSL